MQNQEDFDEEENFNENEEDDNFQDNKTEKDNVEKIMKTYFRKSKKNKK